MVPVDDALKNGEYNPYEKILERQDLKDKQEEKNNIAARSPYNTQRSSLATSQAESYQGTHVVMTNTSMAKLKKKLGSIVPDRQYQMPQYMIIENHQTDKVNLDVKDKRFLEKYVYAENKDKKVILKNNQRQLLTNLSKSPAELGDALKITRRNQTNIFLKDNGVVTAQEVLADQSGIFRYKLGDSIGDGALDMLRDGATGFMPKMTHIRDLSPASTRDLVIQHSSSQASLKYSDGGKEPILTQDQE